MLMLCLLPLCRETMSGDANDGANSGLMGPIQGPVPRGLGGGGDSSHHSRYCVLTRLWFQSEFDGSNARFHRPRVKTDRPLMKGAEPLTASKD